MKQSLLLIEDVAGQRLVLSAPPSGIFHTVRGTIASGWQAAMRLLWEIGQRPRSPRELLASFGMVLLVVLLAALVSLACVMAVVGAGLVLVLYAIGAWLLAWLLVPAAARYAIDARSRGRAHESLTRLSFERETGELSWAGAGGGRSSFAALSGMRISVRSHPGECSRFALQLLRTEGLRTARLHFSVTGIDREEEAIDLCLRFGRVLGWRAFATTRDHLQALEIELRPAPPHDRPHPFRSYAPPSRFHEIGDTPATLADASATGEPGFREPAEPLPAFAANTVASAKGGVKSWQPGRVVELRATRAVGATHIARGMLVATCAALALPVSVLVMINAAGRVDLLQTQQNGRLSFAGVIAILTGASAGVGWLVAAMVAIRRTGQIAATLDWTSRSLAIRDDDGRHVIAFSEIAELVLTEVADRSFTLSAAFKARAPRLLLESEPATGTAEPFLALTVELARSLDVAWRCTSDVA